MQVAHKQFRTLRGPKWPLRVVAIEASGSSSFATPVHGQNVDSTADSVVAQTKFAWTKGAFVLPDSYYKYPWFERAGSADRNIRNYFPFLPPYPYPLPKPRVSGSTVEAPFRLWPAFAIRKERGQSLKNLFSRKLDSVALACFF